MQSWNGFANLTDVDCNVCDTCMCFKEANQHRKHLVNLASKCNFIRKLSVLALSITSFAIIRPTINSCILSTTFPWSSLIFPFCKRALTILDYFFLFLFVLSMLIRSHLRVLFFWTMSAVPIITVQIRLCKANNVS